MPRYANSSRFVAAKHLLNERGTAHDAVSGKGDQDQQDLRPMQAEEGSMHRYITHFPLA